MDDLQSITPALKENQLADLDCDGPVHAGVRLGLSLRLDEMCARRDAALDWGDPKGVHKMRVASRRLRSALRDFAPYLGKRRISSCLKQVKAIAKALGHVRDNDVAIITLEQTASKAPAEIANGIRRLAQFRDADREEARAQVTSLIAHESLTEVTENFQTMLDRAPRDRVARSSREKGAAAIAITYREVGSSIILTRLDELEELSNNLYQPLKAKPLHELRIGVKHLRYALQLFEQCWGTPMHFFAEKLAALQTSLGELHDCDVWIEDLGELAQKESLGSDFDHRRTVVWLLRHFVKVRGKHVNAALNQWQEWEAKGFSARLRNQIAESDSASQA